LSVLENWREELGQQLAPDEVWDEHLLWGAIDILARLSANPPIVAELERVVALAERDRDTFMIADRGRRALERLGFAK
jgi:hypothetical protein